MITATDGPVASAEWGFAKLKQAKPSSVEMVRTLFTGAALCSFPTNFVGVDKRLVYTLCSVVLYRKAGEFMGENPHLLRGAAQRCIRMEDRNH